MAVTIYKKLAQIIKYCHEESEKVLRRIRHVFGQADPASQITTLVLELVLGHNLTPVWAVLRLCVRHQCIPNLHVRQHRFGPDGNCKQSLTQRLSGSKVKA